MRRTIVLCCILMATSASAQIRNIGTFLDQCPQNDPAISLIRSDFQIRRAGVPVTGIPQCSEPVHAMATSAYTDELILLQALRVIYYMDRGKSGHLPWTGGTMYDWMKSKIGGIDIVQGYSFCCEYFDLPAPVPGEPPPAKNRYIGVGAQDDFNREFDKTWRGISGDIDLIAHETRHVDGFPHVSCCGIPGGCDQTFDGANLSPYGVQWWLNTLWLDGTINVGMACLTQVEYSASINWFLSGINSQYASRFCDMKPQVVDAPAKPGGRCPLMPRRHAVRRGTIFPDKSRTGGSP